MEYIESNPIGNRFKKENVFLATIVYNSSVTKQTLKEEKVKHMPKFLLNKLVDKGIISTTEVDIFYLDENGYTRFDICGSQTFKGDNSDGEGLIINVVSAWKYYNEDEVKEVKFSDSYFAIAQTTIKPLERYNNDYNIQNSKTKNLKTIVEVEDKKYIDDSEAKEKKEQPKQLVKKSKKDNKSNK